MQREPVSATGPRRFAVLAIAATLLVAGCDRGGAGARDPDTRAVVTGVDGAARNILDQLAAQARTPHRTRLPSG